MSNILYWLLVVIVCAFALGGAYFSFILILLSGFIIDDVGYANPQRQAVGSKAMWISLLGVISFCGSIFIVLFSNRVAGFLFKFLGLRFSK